MYDKCQDNLKSKMESIKMSYVSAGCNRTLNAIDWGYNNLICYGACNGIVIWNTKNSKIEHTLHKHTDRVNTVKWIKTLNGDAETQLVSGSTDKNVILWTWNDDGYTARNILTGHTQPVSAVDAIYCGDKKDILVVSTSADSTVKIWKCSEYNYACLQTISMTMCVALRLSFLPKYNIPILACSSSDNRIRLYVLKRKIECETEDSMYDDYFEGVCALRGHKGWVHGIDMIHDGNNYQNNLMLASCSQDTYIRIWKISLFTDQKKRNLNEAEDKSAEIEFKKTIFNANVNDKPVPYSVTLESVLAGHESWVYGINWLPKQYSKEKQTLKLLSSSADKSMVIWVLDPETDIWMDSTRVGKVGGNAQGFFGSAFSPNGQKFIGYGYTGSFHMWQFCEETNSWLPDLVFGGHGNEVNDMAWEPKGKYLVSVSKDQTTRIHAPWVLDKTKNKIEWHEIARPQVHGHDMNCLAILSRYKFVSGADEKVARVFTAPKDFVTNFRLICKINNDPEGEEVINGAAPLGASVPALDLSNKAVFDLSTKPEKVKSNIDYPENSPFTHIVTDRPPTEEHLHQNTLWPEVQKLYGHANEVFALAPSPDGKILASSCKASSLEHAAVIIWDANTYQKLQILMSHTLTVVQLSFSPDGLKLLSVGRDRKWSVFERDNQNGLFTSTYQLEKKAGVHTRIIWCGDWSHESRYFITGSRDGRAAIWHKPPDTSNSYLLANNYIEFKNESVMAASFAPKMLGNDYVVAIGFESGVIRIFRWNKSDGWTQRICLNQNMAHHLSVKKLAFRPLNQEDSNIFSNIMQLASCSLDHSIKIFDIDCNLL